MLYVLLKTKKKGIYVTTAAAVTSYSRVHINTVKLRIINELKGKVYYSYTDSIITHTQLPEYMVQPTNTGKLKLEHTVQCAVMPAPKLYILICKHGKTIKKSKGNDN